MVGWNHRLNGHEQVLEMVKDRQVWSAAARGVTESRTRLRD